MKLPDIAPNAVKRFTTTEKIMGVVSGAPPPHLILEIFVQNLKGQKIGFKGTILHNTPFAAERKKMPKSDGVGPNEFLQSTVNKRKKIQNS